MPARRIARSKLPSTSGFSITHSARADWLDCNRKYYYRYERLLAPKVTPSALVVGELVHKGLAAYMLGSSPSEVLEKVRAAIQEVRRSHLGDPQELETDAVAVEAMLASWGRNRGLLRKPVVWDRGGVKWVEKPFVWILPNGDQVVGKIDAAVVDKQGVWLVEHKTTSQLGKAYVDRLAVDGQVTLYYWAMTKLLGYKPVGAIYNVIRKPSIRRKEGESHAQYQQRIGIEYVDRPDHYFFQTKLFRDDTQLERFEQSLLATNEDIKRSQSRNLWVQNTGNCTRMGTCPFLPICGSGERPEIMGSYAKRELRHPETVS